jgi:S-layer homology domain
LATSLATAFALTSRASSKLAKVAVPKLADGPMVGSSAVDNVQAVIRVGYMNVFADGTFRPSSSVTRAETAGALFEAIRDNPR